MKFYETIEINDYLSVEFYADFIMENDGVGSNEYWGIKDNHSGTNYWEMDSNIEWALDKHTPEENKIIEKFLDENQLIVENELYKKAEKFDPSHNF